MKTAGVLLLSGCLIFLSFLALSADPSRTGYSGAPGSKGTCASSCHGFPGGAITISGFPSTYTPGQVYTLKVAHSDTIIIANFNASVRIGSTSSNAGVLSAGLNTTTYNVTQETNGIHWASPFYADSGIFSWTAPDTSVGEVKLYLAGHQGTTADDYPNTELVLSSTPGICLAKPGDANGDNNILLSDIVTLINFLFKSQPAPNPLCRGDANADSNVLLSDIVYLINFIFKSGSAPVKSQECCL